MFGVTLVNYGEDLKHLLSQWEQGWGQRAGIGPTWSGEHESGGGAQPCIPGWEWSRQQTNIPTIWQSLIL